MKFKLEEEQMMLMTARRMLLKWIVDWDRMEAYLLLGITTRLTNTTQTVTATLLVITTVMATARTTAYTRSETYFRAIWDKESRRTGRTMEHAMCVLVTQSR